MTASTAKAGTKWQETSSSLRHWAMTTLTLFFVLLYGAALVGWLKPLDDERLVDRLEPIIFVLIGYYFGRLPSQQNEGALKNEIHRQTQRADAALHAKEQIQQVREALEEKLKNVKAALNTSAKGLPGGSGKTEAMEPARSLMSVALNILDS
jgi:hypothetical protein